MIVRARTPPVGIIIHGCWKMYCEAVCTMPPHVGSGGCGPSPMKARPACRPIAAPNSSTNCTMTVVDMLGSTCRRLAVIGLTPSTAAASTYSCWCRDLACPKNTRYSAPKSSRPNAIITRGMFVPTAAMKARMMTVPGSDSTISLMRFTKPSARA
jgi:hypothetical protein